MNTIIPGHISINDDTYSWDPYNVVLYNMLGWDSTVIKTGIFSANLQKMQLDVGSEPYTLPNLSPLKLEFQVEYHTQVEL